MTSRKSKGTEKPKPKKLSNPASTGGGGTSFESRVQASRLLAMCLGSLIPGGAEGRIVELRFQARFHGHHTDDLVCHIEQSDGKKSRVLLQMKRALTARAKDSAFSESVGAAWTDFNSISFVRGQDSIFFVYDTASAAAMKGALTVCSWARYSATSDEFLKKVDATDFSNASNRNALAAIGSIAESYAGRHIDADELHEFVKHLNCLPHDLDQDFTSEHVGHLNAIQQAARLVGEPAHPQEVWSALVTACMTANGTAATVTFGNLEVVIGQRLNGLFAGARSFWASNHPAATLARQIPARSGVAADAVAVELARLSAVVESLKVGNLQSAVQDQLPAARSDSVNKLISGQLDGVYARIKELRYRDAFEDLVRIGESRSQFDAHQDARWHFLQGTCKWHLESGQAAAADFTRAAELCYDEDKFAAAGVRGLLLSGDASGAVAAGAKAQRTFPDSLAVWLAVANARMNIGDALSLEDIPTALRNEAEALQMLAWSRSRAGDKAGAARAALQALDAAAPSFFTRDTALTLCLDHAAGDGVNAAFRVFGVEERTALVRCTTEFSPREERLWRVQSPGSVVMATANLATAHLLLGQPDVALAVLQEARARDIDSPAFLRVEFESLAAVGNLRVAIAAGQSQIDKMPKEALAAFAQLAGEAGDLQAVDQAIDAAKKLRPEQPEFLRSLTGMRWTVLAKIDVKAALEAVRGSDWETTHAVPELVAAAQILHSAGHASEASQRIQRAQAMLVENAESSDLYLVAQCLLFARDYVQAALVFERIAPSGKHSQLHADLLYCYLRSGRRAKAKQLIDAFPPGWESHSDTRHLAMELAQLASDWTLLTRLVPAELAQAPGEVRSWLLKTSVAAHSAAEDVGQVLDAVPEELSGTTQEVTQLAAIELRYAHKERALRRLYVMRRRQLDSTESAAAHVVTHLAITDDLPLMEDGLPAVAPGTSVTLADDEGNAQVFTLDPLGLPELPATSEFLRLGSQEALVLLGLTIGATLSVPDAEGSARVLVVQRICTAYRRLFELSQGALRAPLAPSPIARLVTVGNEQTGEPDFGQLTTQLKKVGDQVKRAIGAYEASPITLGGLAKLAGRDAYDVVRGWNPEGPPIRVSGGSPRERAQAITILQSGNGPFLIDGVTLVELATLESLGVLAALPGLLVTAHTRDLLEAKLAETQTARTVGTAFERDGKLGFVETTAAERQLEVRFLQSIVVAVDKHCRVVPSYGADASASVTSQLDRVVSKEEQSVILAAVEHNATLVTLDARLRFLAGTLGITGVWPQALLMHSRNTGRLSALSYSLATIRQLFSNRTFVSVDSDDLAVMTYQGTDWLRFGLSRIKIYLARPDTEFSSALRVSVHFLRQLATAGPCHFGAICRILQQVAEGLFRHKDSPKDLERTLSEAVWDNVLMGERSAMRRHLVQVSIREALQASRKAMPAGLTDVQVLMCSAPPWIAYKQDSRGDEPSQVETQPATSAKQSEKSGESAGSTYSSEAADNPFRE